jgi:cytochrome c oxidase cbb3-type subunit 3
MMMSNFWSFWIISLTVITVAGVTWILFANRTVNKQEGENTTGHVYDGIEEYDNPLPAWWFNLFLGSVIFAIGYLALYPGMGNYKGLLNWTSTDQWQASVDKADKEFSEKAAQYMAVSPRDLASKPDALKMGKRIFKTYCSVCHGNMATGAYAFPNLTDNDWLYGGTDDKIIETITHGRKGMMPAWGAILGNDLDSMVDYVVKLGDGNAEQHPMHQKFTTICAACHGADGKGNQMFGAPNLTDDIWLYGGKPGDIKITISKGRNGNMPAHDHILSKESIHLVAGYILSLNTKP